MYIPSKLCSFYFLCSVVLVAALMSMNGSRVSAIRSIDSFTEIDWAAVSKNSLVIFDIDGVIIMPLDAIFHPSEHNWALEKKIKEARKAVASKYLLSPNQGGVLHPEVVTCRNGRGVRAGELLSARNDSDYWRRTFLFYKQQKSQLIEPAILKILADLKLRKIKTMALTDSSTGFYASFPSFEKMRIRQLKFLGVDFSSFFPHIPCCRLKRFQSARNKMPPGLKGGRYPVFKKGILFTNKNGKGETLKALLEYLSWAPENVIFIDDRSHFLREVQELCLARGISFNGFLYHGMDSCVQEAKEEIARLQFAYFEKHLIWLSDVKAKKLLNKMQNNVFFKRFQSPKRPYQGGR